MCEYACAAAAVYEYIFEKCVKEHAVMSETGSVDIRPPDRIELDAAAAMRSNALYMLSAAGISKPTGFAFIKV